MLNTTVVFPEDAASVLALGDNVPGEAELKDVVGLGSMITEFQFFNTEGLFYIVRLLFHDSRVDIDL